MNKIEFPRMGVDGVEYTREYIHQWYLNTFHDAIKKRLKGLEYNSHSKGQKEFVRKLIYSSSPVNRNSLKIKSIHRLSSC